MHRRQFLLSTAASTFVLAAPAIVRAQSQSVLRFIPQGDLTILDPVFSTATPTRTHGYMVYDTLFGLDDEFKAVPQMAESATAEDDGKRWTIKLREGLVFHDGQPVTAADCVASIKRWGQNDAFGQALLAATDELSATDAHTITFRLNRPFPLLPNALGKAPTYMCAIMPERLAVTDPKTQITEVVGSGPFRFLADERLAGSRVAYAKFDQYKPSEAGKAGWTAGPKIVHFDRVEWSVIPDVATATNALLNGEADWLETTDADLLPMLRGDSSINVRITDPTGQNVSGRFNLSIKPFDNPAIRRAVLSAIDQTQFMLPLAGGDPAMIKSGVGVFTPGSPLANDEGISAIGSSAGDLGKVADAIKAAGYNGEKVLLMAGSDRVASKLPGDIMADLFQRIGLNVDYQVTDFGSVLQRRTNRESVENGGWSLYNSPWSGADHLDPSGFLLLRGDESFAGWYKSEEMEGLRNEWFAAPDLASQQDAGRKIQKLALEQDVPFLPLGQYLVPTAHRSSITDVNTGFATFWNVKPA